MNRPSSKKAVYILDDTFKISDEVKNMPKEERERQIKILEEAGQKKGESVPDSRPLLNI